MARSKSVTADINRLTASITNHSKKARRAGNRRMEKGVETIAELARVYAPVDEGDLENAIKTKVERGLGGRNLYEVYVDESMPGSNGADSGADYFMIMHETPYQLGPLSSAKDVQVGGNGYGYGEGGVVGQYYLERALNKRKTKVIKEVRDAINRGLK